MRLRLHRIWTVLPVPVLVLPRLPGRLVGVCLGPAIAVHRDWATDWPTIVHELEHCKQFWRGGLVLHFLRYLGSHGYRLECELQAFAAELRACPPALRAQRLDEAARALASGYRLRLDTVACARLLAGRLSG